MVSIQNSGYQGIGAYHANSYVSKKLKDRELSALEKQYDCALGREPMGIEHINRRLKVFKILVGRYRNHRKKWV
jgi:hypothetical protein